MITLQQILNSSSDVLSNSKVKLVRHTKKQVEYRDLTRDRELLIEYQKGQSKDIFGDCDYIISFALTSDGQTALLGVFKVIDKIWSKEEKLFYYNFEHVEEFENLENRLVIDWGRSAINWHQWYKGENKNKEVIEILPEGYVKEFTGLLDFILDFDELENIVKSPKTNKSWQGHLSSINGIYLILDKNTGKQYIGSAYGGEGVWQRWTQYVRTKHGDNKQLKELCKKDKLYYKNFQFSLLQTLPSNIRKKEVIEAENLYKEKLGSRSYGLNSN